MFFSSSINVEYCKDDDDDDQDTGFFKANGDCNGKGLIYRMEKRCFGEYSRVTKT